MPGTDPHTTGEIFGSSDAVSTAAPAPSAVRMHVRRSVQSVTSVTTYALDNAASPYSSANYFVDTAGGRLVLNFGCIWPANLRARAAVEIVYAAGYGDTPEKVPQPIRTGILMHVAALYEQRGQSADALDIPPGAKQLFNQYRVLGDRRG